MLSSPKLEIQDVADTAFWVAYYRAKESERSDAMFRDPFAKELAGERGRLIAQNMGSIGRYTEWSITSRTVRIDRMVMQAIAEGVDLVINLGAGLDSRPYRLEVPKYLSWVEVDSTAVINYKTKILARHSPHCQVTRFSVDLADAAARQGFLNQIAPQGKKILILTEGVVTYLTEENVSELSADLREHENIRYWILEFFDPRIYKILKNRRRSAKMQNALFQFYPADWLGFFEQRGWQLEGLQFATEVATEFKRRIPMPWYFRLMRYFASQKMREKAQRLAGYMLLKRK